MYLKYCEVKWALQSITTNKASGGDGIPVELSQILKDDAVKVLHSICQHIWKTQQWPQDWKMSVFMPIPKNGIAKEYTNYCCFYFFIYYCEYCCNNHGSENTILRTNFKNFEFFNAK